MKTYYKKKFWASVGALLLGLALPGTCLFVGWVVKPKLVIDEVKLSSSFSREKLFVVVVRYIAPVCILLILISSVLDKLGVAMI